MNLLVYQRILHFNSSAQIMNEPHRGYIDLQSMHAFDYNTDLHLGHVRKCVPCIGAVQTLTAC